MNQCQLMGRLTKEPEIRYTNSNTPVAVASFTLAVERRVAKGKESETDFLPVIAWRERAEFSAKYLHKGQRIAITGSIQTRSYTDKENVRRYVTEILADGIFFADGKTSEPAPKQTNNSISQSEDGFVDMDDDYPF